MLYPAQSRRSDPLDLMRSMLRNVEDAYRPLSTQPVYPAVNLWQGEDTVLVTAELPGVEIVDIDITVKDNVLTIAGERKAPEVPEGARWHRNERGFGKFSRAVRLPFMASEDRVEARFQNGVLHVAVGRPEDDKPKRIKIKAV